MSSAASSPPGAKVDPETLVLRAKPRPVTRFKRHVVIGVTAIVVLAVFGATWLALSAPSLRSQTTGGELYNTDKKPTADGLASLPSSYDKMNAPSLGPALPGDLGPSILAHQRELGAGSSAQPSSEAARSEQMRTVQEAQHAREAGLFFKSESALAAVSARASPPAPETDSAPSTAASPPSTIDPHDQNAQQRKLDFLNTTGEKNIYNPNSLQTPVSKYEVQAGTVISGSLITGLDSDLPGFVIGQVTHDIFDSATGTILLIPAGAKIVGTYDSMVAFGQSRALVVWQRIIMPNGSSIQIDNLPATDTEGYAGLEDSVDYHTWALIKGVALSTLLGVGTQLSLGNEQDDLLTALRQSAQDSANQAGQQLTQKNLSIQPTIKVRPGWPLRIVVHKDIILAPYNG